jgi:hypothetical protein
MGCGKTITIIRIDTDEPQFLGYNGRWVNEYPDSVQFGTLSAATNAFDAHCANIEAQIIHNYGYDNERILG